MEQTTEKKSTKRSSKNSTDSFVYGKIPPQAKELEQAVLGAILMEREALDRATAILKPEIFYVEAHQKIFSAMIRLNKKSQPIDILLISDELQSVGELESIGGPAYLIEIARRVVSGAHIESHARIIFQKYVGREIIRVSGDLIQRAYEDMNDGMDLLDYAETAFTDISAANVFGEMVGMDTVLVQAVQKIEEWRKLESPITGISSGFRDLDKATRGFQNGDLIIIAARPSVGKTALALSLVRAAAKQTEVAVWSLEMKAVQLVLRMMAAESKELLHRIQTGRLSDEQMKNIYSKAIQPLSKLNIFFDDKPGLTIAKLRSKARRLKRKGRLGLVVLDYLQLMSSEERKTNREQEVSTFSRHLKNLAQELDVPIIALSQLNRDIESRPNKTPQLSDIRESGAIEQDADVIMFLYGPTDAQISENNSLLNRRYLKIGKQRNGFLCTVDLDFKDEIQFFSELNKLPELGLPSGNWQPVERD